jgi:hypothetical protein
MVERAILLHEEDDMLDRHVVADGDTGGRGVLGAQAGREGTALT